MFGQSRAERVARAELELENRLLREDRVDPEQLIAETLEAERTRVEAPEARLARLAEGLRAHEWVGRDFDGERRCHVCVAYPEEGHQPGCAWAALIAMAEAG